MKMNVKKGDRVRVLTGKDAGAEGVVLEAYPQKQRVKVEKVNVVKKHLSPRRLILQVAFLRWKHRSTFPTSRSFARIARSPRASITVVRTVRRLGFAISAARTLIKSKSTGCTSSRRFRRTLRWP